jgi:hypothetical protein
MPKRQKADEQGPPTGYKLVAYITPIGIVKEGSKVQLDGSQRYFEYDTINSQKLQLLQDPSKPRTEYLYCGSR